MFCPTCGVKGSEEGRYCRSCGTDLAIVAKALSGELLDPRVVEVERIYHKNLFRGAIFVLALILVILTILKFVVGQIDPDSFGPFTLVLIWMAGVLLGVNLWFARYRRRVCRQLLGKELGMSSGAKETARLPRPQRVPPPSVTEGATQRIPQKGPPEPGGMRHE